MTERIKKLLDDATSDGSFLGLGYIAVDKSGRTIYSGVHGRKSFAGDEPLSLSTAGFMASMTKLVTAVAVMQLVEKGVIGLDDDLGGIVPELGDRRILLSFDEEKKEGVYEDPSNKITLRLLLTHTAGFGYEDSTPLLHSWAVAYGRDKELFAGDFNACHRPLVYNPGTKWLYSISLEWAGKVLEKVTGKTLGEYTEENIFSKLGMVNSTFHPGRRNDYTLMDLAVRLPDGKLHGVPLSWPRDPSDDFGGAGLFSTTEDYSKFLTSLLMEDEKLLKKESWEIFTQSHLTDATRVALEERRKVRPIQADIPSEIPLDHALGGLLVTKDVPGRRKKGSMCWSGITCPQWMIDRETGVAITLFTQLLAPGDPVLKGLYAALETEVYSIVHARK